MESVRRESIQNLVKWWNRHIYVWPLCGMIGRWVKYPRGTNNLEAP